MQNQFQIFPVGDSAITIDLGNFISESLNQKVLAMQNWLLAHPFEGLKDSLVAYSSLTIVYNPVAVRKIYQPASTVFSWVTAHLQKAFEQAVLKPQQNREIIRIPVCYDESFAPDLCALAREKGLSPADIVHMHAAGIYNVYMIGFLPGFSYMGEVSEQIAVARKPKPVPVAAGSIGIAGTQTGIYPLNSPGGWQIIGRTPLKMFEPYEPEPVKLQAGDRVQFYSISKKEYDEYKL